MKLKKLELLNFRNLEPAVWEPDGEVNVIVGENAQGKTNLIEAIWMFSGMKSFRGARDAELVAFGRDHARLTAEFEDARRTQTAELKFTDRRRAFRNGIALASPAELLGVFGAVVFCPSFLSIVQSGPAERRRFTDSALCRLKPAYAVKMAEYARLLKQRGALLKDVYQESSLFDMLDVVDERLADAGDAMTAERERFFARLFPIACEIYGGLSGGRETLKAAYERAGGADGAPMRERLRAARKTDLLMKTTSVGPHRDDILLSVDEKPARAYGSQGQQRSCALALKLAEAELIREITGEEPLILLDDVMSELDASRQDYILNHIRNRQVFITCCEPTAVMRQHRGVQITVKSGRIGTCI